MVVGLLCVRAVCVCVCGYVCVWMWGFCVCGLLCVCVCGWVCACVCVCRTLLSAEQSTAIVTGPKGGKATEEGRNLYDGEFDYWGCTADSVTVIGGTGNMQLRNE